MDELKTLSALGFALPTPAYLIGVLLFSIIGTAAYYYGKKTSLKYPKWIGIALMLYPYVVSDTWLLYFIGGGLCIPLYWYRQH